MSFPTGADLVRRVQDQRWDAFALQSRSSRKPGGPTTYDDGLLEIRSLPLLHEWTLPGPADRSIAALGDPRFTRVSCSRFGSLAPRFSVSRKDGGRVRLRYRIERIERPFAIRSSRAGGQPRSGATCVGVQGHDGVPGDQCVAILEEEPAVT